MEGRGHTLIVVVRVHCPWYVPVRFTPQCKERSIPQGGMIMFLRVCVDIAVVCIP